MPTLVSQDVKKPASARFSPVRKLFDVIDRGGLPAPAAQVIRGVLRRRVASHLLFQAQVEDKCGLEIGGPSSIFRDTGELPLYRYAVRIDNCVFSSETIWEGRRSEGQTYVYHPRKSNGSNFIREATDLRDISDRVYDFVLSSHSLEHTANPLKALKEWIRVVKPGGAIVVVLPNHRCTFDWRRQPTSVDHMMEDYQRGTDERDLSHLPEILELHDLSLDLAAGNIDHFRQRSLRNFDNRCLHHHVFDTRNSRKLLEMAGLTVTVQELIKPHHIVMLGRCP